MRAQSRLERTILRRWPLLLETVAWAVQGDVDGSDGRGTVMERPNARSEGLRRMLSVAGMVVCILTVGACEPAPEESLKRQFADRYRNEAWYAAVTHVEVHGDAGIVIETALDPLDLRSRSWRSRSAKPCARRLRQRSPLP